MENNHQRIESLSSDLQEAREQIFADRQEVDDDNDDLVQFYLAHNTFRIPQIANKDGELVILRVTLKATKEECCQLHDEVGFCRREMTRFGTLIRMRIARIKGWHSFENES